MNPAKVNPARANQKGDLAIGAIVSVLITVIGITLLMLFVTQTPSGKKMYCDLSNKYTPKFYETRLDSFCTGTTEHEISGLKSQTLVLDTFSDEHSEQAFTFLFSKLKENFSISMERETTLVSAELSVSNAPREQKLKKFASNNYNETLPPFGRDGGNYTALINISKFVKILNASVDVVGNNYPGILDIVFAIDTSGSMTEEWHSVCQMVKTIGKNLSDFGVKKLSIRVYCIGEGKLCQSAYSSCKNGAITVSNLKTIPISNFTEEKDAPCYKNCQPEPRTTGYYYPGDQYEEAWALTSSFISSNFNWIDNSKKMIILISDSDPTGALETEFYRGTSKTDPARKWSNTQFTGNEQEAINTAVADALENGTYVTLVFGDESSPIEGFNVGCSIDPWDSCCSGNCNQIMKWMEQLSSSTKGNLIAYRDTEALQKSVIDAVMSSYPLGIKVEINGNVIGTHASELNKKNSPWTINGTEFKEALESELENCEPDDSGYCLIPINVFSATDGTIILNNLEIVYKGIAYNLSVELSNQNILKVPRLYDEAKVFDFTDVLNKLKRNCDTDMCDFNFTVSVTKPAEILFDNLSIIYRKYYIREALLDAIVECWKKADFGRSETDILCQEFTIPYDYEFFKPITEEDMAKLIIKRQWCHIIGSSDYDCGEEDNIEFTKAIDIVTNVMIEYKADKKKVVLS